MMHWGFGWPGMMIGGLLMLLFWGALIALAVLVVRALARSGGTGLEGGSYPAQREDSALAILRERYARGEIDKEQYERMRSDLLK